MPGIPSDTILRSGPMTCTLHPGLGGSLGRLTFDTGNGLVDLVRYCPDRGAAPASSLDLAGFPLVPFSNRIAEGRFEFNGRRVRLPAGCGPHAIHGDGWTAMWNTVETGSDFARLVYHHPGGAWPWRYTAEQTFRLYPDGLDITLSITNEANEPMPAGIGLHPYFPAPTGTRLEAGVEGVWTNDETGLPADLVELPEHWGFDAGVQVEGTAVDNCFTGWNGQARLVWADHGRALRIEGDEAFGHLVIYAPDGEGYVCIEPVSHRNDAFNDPNAADHGVRVLAPGESLSGTVRFRVETTN